jgi:hypothetical protein
MNSWTETSLDAITSPGLPLTRMGHGRRASGTRSVLSPVICCVAAVALAACGSSSQGDATVVRVNGEPITKAQVDHWMSAVAASASVNPGEPKFTTPQPPGYEACIAYLKKYPAFGATVEPVDTASRAAVKGKCEFEYEKEKLKALYDLIGPKWVAGEAAELAVATPTAELNRVLTAFSRQFSGKAGSFRQYLASMGETPGDERALLEEELLAKAVQRKLEAQPSMQGLTTQQRQSALNRFSAGFLRKWRARTSCQPGYVVPICRQYMQPKTPPKLVPNALPLTNLAPE